MENEDETLPRGLAELNLSDRSALSFSLRKYVEEIELFNPSYGLVKVADRRELIIKHILDSLSPLNIISRLLNNSPDPEVRQHIADVGSGAGLPGIPLAMAFPDAEFTLIERMGRRAGFLRNCTAVLGLANVNVEEADMEKTIPGRFDLAVFRAFRPLEPDVLKSLFRLIKADGFLAAWKGRMEKTREEMATAEISLPGLKWEMIPLSVPFLEEERCLVIINNPASVSIDTVQVY